MFNTRSIRSVALTFALAALPAAQSGTWVQSDKLVPAEGYAEVDNLFGRAISRSGKELAVGAPGNGTTAGSVYFMAASSGRWFHAESIQPDWPIVGEDFGRTVAFSGDLLFVGAPLADGNRGAVYVFRRTAGVWNQEVRLTPPSIFASLGEYDFGRSIRFKNDQLLVGAPARGKVYVYGNVDQDWLLTTTLCPFPEARGFGYSVHFNGTMALISAPDDEAVYLYSYSPQEPSWTLIQRIQAPVANPDFGYAIAVSGPRMAIGSPESNGGCVYYYERVGVEWLHVATIPAPSFVRAEFGYALDIEGANLIVGAPARRTRDGRAAVYSQDPTGAWTLVGEIVPDTNLSNTGSFGYSVAMIGSLAYVNIGLDDAPVFGRYAGAVNVYRLSGAASSGLPSTEDD